MFRRDDPAGHIRFFRLLAIPSKKRLVRVLGYRLDEKEFLSPYGVRSVSRVYLENPSVFWANGTSYQVDSVPAESNTGLFGGNSNWRGPIWFPVNFLLVEALERYHHFYGDELKVECPTRSGKMMTLREVARKIARRLSSIFLPGERGRRPCHGEDMRYAKDPHWKDLVLFNEYSVERPAAASGRPTRPGGRRSPFGASRTSVGPRRRNSATRWAWLVKDRGK